MNMISPFREHQPATGYVIVNIRGKRPLYFTGLFESIGRNMSADIDDAYVFETRRAAEAYMELNALVDDLDIRSYQVEHLGFGRRAKDYARAILANQNVKDIAGFAASCLFGFAVIAWLAILSSVRGL